MHEKSDAQLLSDYAQHGDETAFAELVSRHTNLVYSAAWRQVGSPEIAAEVTQSVFIGLARGARSLSPRLSEDASLAGWLCRSARNISLNLRRDEFRRHSRERQAMEHFDSTPETVPDWERLCPVLDAAMSELDETDYDALVMRFFKNQDLQSVGLALGVSDDCAQKRVSRALDKLREHLSRHGVSTSAAALSVVLTANAVQAAPVGLTVTISTAATLAGTAFTSTATATAIKTIAMTTLQKTLITVTIATAVGTGIYEARQAATFRRQVQTLRQQSAPLAEQIEQLTKDRDEATRRLAALRDDNERLNRNTAELARLRGKIGLLQQALASRPQPQNANADWKPGTPRRLEEMSDVGQATPEAALQTTIWAALANPQRLMDLVHLPAPGSTHPERLEQMRQAMANSYTNVDWALVKEVTIERSDYSKHKHFDLVKDKDGNIHQHAGDFDDYVEVHINYPGREEAGAAREKLSETDLEENPLADLLPTRWRFTRVGEEWRQVIPGASPDNLTKPADVPSK